MGVQCALIISNKYAKYLMRHSHFIWGKSSSSISMSNFQVLHDDFSESNQRSCLMSQAGIFNFEYIIPIKILERDANESFSHCQLIFSSLFFLNLNLRSIFWNICIICTSYATSKRLQLIFFFFQNLKWKKYPNAGLLFFFSFFCSHFWMEFSFNPLILIYSSSA